MDFEAEINQKAAQLVAAGFDPGPATAPITTVGAGAFRTYQRAVITAHPVAGVREVHGLIMDRYFNRMGGPSSFLGFPTTDESVAGVGRFNRFEFQGSAICWHLVFGVHEVHGLIGDHYWNVLGGPAGVWGFPLSDEYPDGAAGRSSDFQLGTLNFSPTDGILEVVAAVPGVTPTAGDWVHVAVEERMRYAVGQLVFRLGYPPNGAAGIVGNLFAESGILPTRLEGSQESSPMRAQNFAGVTTDFTAEMIMLRPNPGGPRLPGVGLAQWTSASRRAGMFTHMYNGVPHGAQALFGMDVQLDYLVTELTTGFVGVNRVLLNPAVTVDAASDEVVYNFEVPGAILDSGRKLPRSDSRVQDVFTARRQPSRRARAAFGP